MKTIKVRSFTSAQDFIDWLCFYKIQPEQILDSWQLDYGKGVQKVCVTYWMEFQED